MADSPATLYLSPPTIDLGVIWRQYKHPVYNALGRQIGSYDTLADFCAGRWYLFKGETQPPNDQLRIVDFWGRRVPAPQRCLDTRQATTIATPGQVQAKAVEVEKQGRAIIPGTTITLPTLPTVPPINQIPYSQLALWGAAGLIAIALLRRPA